MTDAPDAKLLEQFTRDNSEAAFTTLVERHIGLVHSVAVRHTANPQSAQDITQAVFIILARKAASLNRKTVLPGWLYHTARLTAANFQRAETSRIRREQEAYMQSTLQESAPDAIWPEMSPLLDEAMSHLGASDRDALVLRYFQNKSLSEVGIAMGLEERTAQKRVTRAIEKLRKFFAQRGVTLSGAAIAGAVSANSVQAAPVALVKTISAIAIAKGAAATTSTLTLVKGALKIMAWTKMKTVAVAAVAVILAAGTATPIIIHHYRTKSSISSWTRELTDSQLHHALSIPANVPIIDLGVIELAPNVPKHIKVGAADWTITEKRDASGKLKITAESPWRKITQKDIAGSSVHPKIGSPIREIDDLTGLPTNVEITGYFGDKLARYSLKHDAN